MLIKQFSEKKSLTASLNFSERGLFCVGARGEFLQNINSRISRPNSTLNG